MRTIKLFLIAALGAATLSVSAQRQNTDQLDRGLIAIQTSEGIYCSWRIQADEYYDTQYNLYRNGAKVNEAPLSVSNLLVKDGTASDSYTVRAIVRGVEQEASNAANVWAQKTTTSGYVASSSMLRSIMIVSLPTSMTSIAN